MSDILTVLDVEKISFSKAMRGYNTEEVEEFLEKVARTCPTLEKTRPWKSSSPGFDERGQEYTELNISAGGLVLRSRAPREG
jgi:DivIVA domain-containing protein